MSFSSCLGFCQVAYTFKANAEALVSRSGVLFIYSNNQKNVIPSENRTSNDLNFTSDD